MKTVLYRSINRSREPGRVRGALGAAGKWGSRVPVAPRAPPRRQGPCLGVNALCWSDHPMWSGSAVELRGRLGTPGAEHLATGGRDRSRSPELGPVEEVRRERKEAEQDMKEVPLGVPSKRQNQLSVAGFLGARPTSPAGYQMPCCSPGGRAHRDPPCSSASAQ